MEDRRQWPKEMSIEQRLANPAPYCTRHMPITTIGWGAGNIVYKSSNSHHSLALETGSWEKFNTARFEVRTMVVDGGLEEDLASTPCLYNESFECISQVIAAALAGSLTTVDGAAYFLPICLLFSDFLHIIYNALEEVCTKHHTWLVVGPHLKAIAGFLSVKDLRNRFIKKCLVDRCDKQLFHTWSGLTWSTFSWHLGTSSGKSMSSVGLRVLEWMGIARNHCVWKYVFR